MSNKINWFVLISLCILIILFNLYRKLGTLFRNSVINESFSMPNSVSSPYASYLLSPIETTGSYVRNNIYRATQWQSGPRKLFPQLIQALGTPYHLDVASGGEALWTQKYLLPRDICWEQVRISDQPQNFLTIEFKLPLDLILDSNLKLLNTLSPCQEIAFKDNLISKGNSVIQVIYQLVIAKRFLLNEISWDQARLDLSRWSDLSFGSETLRKLNIELCSIGIPLTNDLGELSPTEIYTLRPGGQPKPVLNERGDLGCPK